MSRQPYSEYVSPNIIIVPTVAFPGEELEKSDLDVNSEQSTSNNISEQSSLFNCTKFITHNWQEVDLDGNLGSDVVTSTEPVSSTTNYLDNLPLQPQGTNTAPISTSVKQLTFKYKSRNNLVDLTGFNILKRDSKITKRESTCTLTNHKDCSKIEENIVKNSNEKEHQEDFCNTLNTYKPNVEPLIGESQISYEQTLNETQIKSNCKEKNKQSESKEGADMEDKMKRYFRHLWNRNFEKLKDITDREHYSRDVGSRSRQHCKDPHQESSRQSKARLQKDSRHHSTKHETTNTKHVSKRYRDLERKFIAECSRISKSESHNRHISNTVKSTRNQDEYLSRNLVQRDRHFQRFIRHHEHDYENEHKAPKQIKTETQHNRKILTKPRENTTNKQELKEKLDERNYTVKRELHSQPNNIDNTENCNLKSVVSVKNKLQDEFSPNKNMQQDLREKLSRKRTRSDCISYPKLTTENKQGRDNLVITVNQDVKTDSNTPTSEPNMNKPKSKKCKRIKLVINIECPNSDSNNSDEECTKCSASSPQQDLSFLDDFNVDEIVDSLNVNHSRKVCQITNKINEHDNKNNTNEKTQSKSVMNNFIAEPSKMETKECAIQSQVIDITSDSESQDTDVKKGFLFPNTKHCVDKQDEKLNETSADEASLQRILDILAKLKRPNVIENAIQTSEASFPFMETNFGENLPPSTVTGIKKENLEENHEIEASIESMFSNQSHTDISKNAIQLDKDDKSTSHGNVFAQKHEDNVEAKLETMFNNSEHDTKVLIKQLDGSDAKEKIQLQKSDAVEASLETMFSGIKENTVFDTKVQLSKPPSKHKEKQAEILEVAQKSRKKEKEAANKYKTSKTDIALTKGDDKHLKRHGTNKYQETLKKDKSNDKQMAKIKMDKGRKENKSIKKSKHSNEQAQEIKKKVSLDTSIESNEKAESINIHSERTHKHVNAKHVQNSESISKSTENLTQKSTKKLDSKLKATLKSEKSTNKKTDNLQKSKLNKGVENNKKKKTSFKISEKILPHIKDKLLDKDIVCSTSNKPFETVIKEKPAIHLQPPKLDIRKNNKTKVATHKYKVTSDVKNSNSEKKPSSKVETVSSAHINKINTDKPEHDRKIKYGNKTSPEKNISVVETTIIKDTNVLTSKKVKEKPLGTMVINYQETAISVPKKDSACITDVKDTNTFDNRAENQAKVIEDTSNHNDAAKINNVEEKVNIRSDKEIQNTTEKTEKEKLITPIQYSEARSEKVQETFNNNIQNKVEITTNIELPTNSENKKVEDKFEKSSKEINTEANSSVKENQATLDTTQNDTAKVATLVEDAATLETDKSGIPKPKSIDDVKTTPKLYNAPKVASNPKSKQEREVSIQKDEKRKKVEVESSRVLTPFVAKLEARMLAYLDDQFTVISLIHNGRCTDIYKCQDAKGNPYAIKVINVKNRGLLQEKMLCQLQTHRTRENSTILYLFQGFGVVGNRCLLTEYYPKNLQQALDENMKGFHIDLVQYLSRQLIDAVKMLTTNNIIHSDIKPSHILLNSKNDRLKLCGFDRSNYSNTLNIVPSTGTASYRAPEIILGFPECQRIDIWAAALVMFEMATNVQLFPGQFNNDILFQQLCVLGSLEASMVENSEYSHIHFSGLNFKRVLAHKMFILVNVFHRNKRLRKQIYSTYNRDWARSRTGWQVKMDHVKLESFYALLLRMLVMDPRQRLPINFVHMSEFLNQP